MFLFFLRKRSGEMKASLLLPLLFFLPCHLQFFFRGWPNQIWGLKGGFGSILQKGETNIAKPSFSFPNDTALQMGESELNEAAKKGKGSLLNLSFRQKIPIYVLSFFFPAQWHAHG